MRRRALLQAGACAAIAGCQSVLSDDAEPLWLGVVEFINTVEDEQTLEIEVFADDELVADPSVTLDAASAYKASSAEVKKSWPDEAQSYTIRVETAVEDEPVEKRLDEAFTEDCETVRGIVSPDQFRMSRGSDGKCYEES